MFAKNREKIGEGTFGIVYSCNSPTTGKEVAIKRCFAEQETSGVGNAKEVSLLAVLGEHPFVVSLRGLIWNNESSAKNSMLFSPILGQPGRDNQRDDSFSLVFDKADYDMFSFVHPETDAKLQAKLQPQIPQPRITPVRIVQPRGLPNLGLTTPKAGGQPAPVVPDFALIKRYMLQCLLGLEHIHNRGIVHRDIKINNILIYEATRTAKICDVGLAKFHTNQAPQTPGVAMVLYKAPEIALGMPDYTAAVDIWALGCVFFHLVAKCQFLIIPHDTTDDDFVVSKILGSLPDALSKRDIIKLTTSLPWRTKPLVLYPCHNPKVRPTWVSRLGLTPEGIMHFQSATGSLELFCDLLSGMLRFDWGKRLDVSACINHPWFADQTELIRSTRVAFPPVDMYSHKLYPVFNQERAWVAEITQCIFNSKVSIEGYTHRTMFQTLDIYDRFMQLRPPGLTYTKEQVELRLYTIFYLCIKYFTSTHQPITFGSLLPIHLKRPELMDTARGFESTLLHTVLKHDIYRHTLYEAADCFGERLSELRVQHLLEFLLTRSDIYGLKLLEAYSLFQQYSPVETTINVLGG